MAKCPKCEHTVPEAKLEHMNVSDGQLRIKAFSASCPNCHTILGVVTDPRPMDEAFVAIKKALRAI